jgi:hypothetical protein
MCFAGPTGLRVGFCADCWGNRIAWRAAPWTGREVQGALYEPDRSFSRILYNTPGRIVCKRAYRRRRCPTGR